jgi:hypothetical protein
VKTQSEKGVLGIIIDNDTTAYLLSRKICYDSRIAGSLLCKRGVGPQCRAPMQHQLEIHFPVNNLLERKDCMG